MTIHYISGNRELDECIARLEDAEEIAIDLEFDKNRYRYGFNLCLVQLCRDEDCYLVDPLCEGLEIERLFPLLEDAQIQKVVFAFGEDLRLLHTLGCYPKNIYDLNIATSLLNYEPASLTNYIAEILDRDTGKSSQQSNWYNRPLTDDQKRYAAQDVLHLIDLKRVLEAEAKEKGLEEWIAEENAIMDELDFSGTDDKSHIREKDKKGLSEKEWFLLKKLLDFREEIARTHNKPSYQVIKKDYLVELAKDSRSLMKWQDMRGIYRRIKTAEYKDRIAALLRDAALEAEKEGLSGDKPAAKRLDKEEYRALREERERVNRIKNSFFGPIKNRLIEDYGKQAATFMLSNRIMAEVIRGEQELEAYKRELVVRYARELNLDEATLLELVEA